MSAACNCFATGLYSNPELEVVTRQHRLQEEGFFPHPWCYPDFLWPSAASLIRYSQVFLYFVCLKKKKRLNLTIILDKTFSKLSVPLHLLNILLFVNLFAHSTFKRNLSTKTSAAMTAFEPEIKTLPMKYL